MEVKKCTIFTLSEAWTNCEIEVQRCWVCKRKFIGPDCRSLGLFNWNNNILFTEELLDEYTSQYTSSETPFIAFVTSVARRYAASRSSASFITATTFRGVWFAYAGLLHLERDMTCPKCGENPHTIIADGVTLSYQVTKLLGTLRPPSTVDENSQVKDKQRPMTNMQALTNKELRTDIRLVLSGPKSSPDLSDAINRLEKRSARDTADNEQEENAARISENKRDKQKVESAQAWTHRMNLISSVAERLGKVDEGLHKLWTRCFGGVKRAGKFAKHLGVYMELFKQVRGTGVLIMVLH